MKRLIIIVEGWTEREFVYSILGPYFNGMGVYNNIKGMMPTRSGGGVAKYSHIERDIRKLLKEDKDVVVSTMIDFYRLKKAFPGMEKFYKSKEQYSNKNDLEWVELVEKGIKKRIEDKEGKIFNNLIPYIQLHEFEALIFSSEIGVKGILGWSRRALGEFRKIVKEFPNPEDINSRPERAPSKRLKSIDPNYQKASQGVEILKLITMEVAREKCHHFNKWIESLKEALKEDKGTPESNVDWGYTEYGEVCT